MIHQASTGRRKRQQEQEEAPALSVILAAIVRSNGLPTVLETLANLEAAGAAECLKRNENREAYDRSLAAKVILLAASYIAKGTEWHGQEITLPSS